MFEYLVLCGGSPVSISAFSNCGTVCFSNPVPSVYEENVIDFSENLKRNIKITESFRNLGDNWNCYGAVKFSDLVIDKAISALYFLERQPDVFPTGRNSIQFEYEKSNGDYLEFEIFENSITAFSIISGEENERTVNEEEMKNMVAEFYGRI